MFANEALSRLGPRHRERGEKSFCSTIGATPCFKSVVRQTSLGSRIMYIDRATTSKDSTAKHLGWSHPLSLRASQSDEGDVKFKRGLKGS